MYHAERKRHVICANCGSVLSSCLNWLAHFILFLIKFEITSSLCSLVLSLKSFILIVIQKEKVLAAATATASAKEAEKMQASIKMITAKLNSKKIRM